MTVFRPTDRGCGNLQAPYDSDTDKLLRIEGDSWSALYNKTTSDMLAAGDTYIVDELIFMLCGIEQEQGSHFLCGTSRSAARTIKEMREWQQERRDALRLADELEAQAAELRAQVQELRA